MDFLRHLVDFLRQPGGLFEARGLMFEAMLILRALVWWFVKGSQVDVLRHAGGFFGCKLKSLSQPNS